VDEFAVIEADQVQIIERFQSRRPSLVKFNYEFLNVDFTIFLRHNLLNIGGFTVFFTIVT
jgi:hypothetical protein